MRKISKPRISVKNVFLDCIGNVRDKRFKSDLIDSVDVLISAENEYDQKIINHDLHTIPHNQEVNAVVDKSVLISVYTDRMVNKTNKARIHYDTLMALAPNGRCPFCAQRIASTLDHYLPKSIYPLLSVAPLNLVPSCFDCNRGKLIEYPSNPEEEILHPYYDDVDSFIWLKACLKSVSPIIITFYAEPPQDIDALLSKRIVNHFDSLELNILYTSHAVEEFENIKSQLTLLFRKGGSKLLSEYLSDCYDSRSCVCLNSWQSAFYKSLLSNTDFCNGSFIDA